MASSVVMILALTAIFLAAVLNLAVDSRFRKRLNRFSLIFAGTAGIFFYGYGYAWNQGLTLISMIRALLAVSRVFPFTRWPAQRSPPWDSGCCGPCG